MVKTSLELANMIAGAASDKKARDIALMNMEGLTPATDYFVVCSAGSTTQVRAIADNIEDKLKEEAGIEFMHKEGYREGEWILMDYGDCVAHIFLQDTREYYSLETLWGDAELTAYEE
ncbi:MAG: ribosome silencing factor [Anaerovibrio sp.]|nr:ribosome silencing factor [Anaerovibrio sp.]